MDILDKIINTFSKKIDYVRRASMGVPKTFVIDLSIPITDQPYDISGNLYYIWSAPTETDYIDIKVNQSSEPALRCVRQTGLITPFEKLLITTPAGQTGDLVILYGTEAPELLSIIDNRSATVAGLTDILAELQGDLTPETIWGANRTVGLAAVQVLAANADRKSCRMEMQPAIDEIIFLGFSDAVTSVRWVAALTTTANYTKLDFEMNDYRGEIWAIASAIDQHLMVSEW